MKCPVCGKHVAEERYEVHVGRHSGAEPETAAPEAEEAVPAAVGVGAETVQSKAVVPGIDTGALRLGPQGDAVPLVQESDTAVDDEAAPVDDLEAPAPVDEDGPATDDDLEAPPPGDEDAPPADDDVGDAAIAEAVTDGPEFEEPSDDQDEPADATAPLPLEPTETLDVDEEDAGWGAPVPVGGGQRLAPLPPAPRAARRSTLPLLGLVALVAIAAVIAYALSNDDDDNGTRASRVRTAPTTTPTFPAIVPTVTPTTAPPAAGISPTPAGAIPPVPAGGGLTTPPPGAGPGAGASTGAGTGQIQIQPTRADCNEDSLTVEGTIINGGGVRYNVAFAVSVVSSNGQTLGTARSSVAGIGPGERRPFQATGGCFARLGPGDRPQVMIESITPA